MPSFDEWYDNLPEPERKAARSVSSGGSSKYALRALGYEVTELLQTTEGGRNHQLNAAAFAMGQLIAGGEIDEGSVRATLENAAAGIGLDPVETEKTISSGFKAGANQPRSPEARPGTGGGAPVPEATEWEEGPGEGHDGPQAGVPEATELADDDEEYDSWSKVDLSQYLDGSYEPPQPTMMPRSDGRNLIYPGLVHSIHGESESGKTWVMLAEIARLLLCRRPVAMIDFEDHPGRVVDRLMKLGVPAPVVTEHFYYIRPEARPGAAWSDLMAQTFDLVVIDGVTEALGIFGWATNDNDEIAKFMRKVPKRIAAATGAGVVLIDHVIKSEEGRGRYALGGQHKMNALDGAAYTVETIKPCGVGLIGELSLRIGKDRPGEIRGHCGEYRASDRTQEAARFVLDSSSRPGLVGGFVEMYQSKHDAAQVMAEQERGLMERMSDLIIEMPGINSTAIYDLTVGQKRGRRVTDEAKPALDALVRGGWVEASGGSNNSVLHRSLRPYASSDDPNSGRYAPVTEWQETA